MTHVSIGIPSYNRAHLITRTLDSILNQTHTDWDIVVIDDCSADNSVEVIQEYCRRDARIQLIVNETNLGMTRNNNYCLDMARGPLVTIMPCDDLMDSTWLEKAVAAFGEYPNVGAVVAARRTIDIDDQVLDPGPSQPRRVYPAGDEAVSLLLTQGSPPMPLYVMKRACYEAIGKLDEKIWGGPDVEFIARLSKHYDMYYLGEVLVSMRKHGSNTGTVNFLRQNFLTDDEHDYRAVLSYLSNQKLTELGITDIDQHVRARQAAIALSAAISMLAYGRPDLSRYYLLEAIKRSPRLLGQLRFWRALPLIVLPKIGRLVARRRLNISDNLHDRITIAQQTQIAQQTNLLE